MSTSVFINLPVTDLDASKAFFTGLGYSINENFTDDTAACVVIDDTVYAMLLTRPKFAEFTSRPIGDPQAATTGIYALSSESRAEVDRIADAAIAGGGTQAEEPSDLGFMYSRAFYDLDGHHWEVLWMDPQAQVDGPPSE
ncbi:VOC family protein [Leifsonia sp. Leaf264]|uniref:VOC family protein n=1 Tax=Leifsonia sp. Leaf264 TaxID=1736314 RepID=UPI000701316C|nr:VOC family protein [Leifsonia sp. Leaf264]KQO99631.1 glyoxalase [Leifsonia sp. Leaf264]